MLYNLLISCRDNESKHYPIERFINDSNGFDVYVILRLI